jgi:guanylate kinase
MTVRDLFEYLQKARKEDYEEQKAERKAEMEEDYERRQAERKEDKKYMNEAIQKAFQEVVSLIKGRRHDIFPEIAAFLGNASDT